MSKARLDQVVAPGDRLRRNLRILTNTKLFSQLQKRYVARVRRLDQAIEAKVEDDYFSNVLGPNEQTRPAIFWGKADQLLKDNELPQWTEVAPCNRNQGDPISIPSNGRPRAMVPPELLLASYLGTIDNLHVWRGRLLDEPGRGSAVAQGEQLTIGLVSLADFHKSWMPLGLIRGRTYTTRRESGIPWALGGFRPAWLEAEARWRGGNLRAHFEQSAETVPFPGEAGKGLEVRVVEQFMAEKRAGFYRRLDSSFDESALIGLESDELQGVAGAMASLVALGYPRALGSDQLLRSLLFGRDALFDRSAARAWFAKAATDNVFIDKARSDFLEQAAQRAAALVNTLRGYRKLISKKKYAEGQRFIVAACITQARRRT
jgi:hypothetical protein